MTDIKLIKDRLDIVQIIGEYMPLKKAGINYKACCPFHHEKTPSFMVQPEKQIWHCFGCNLGGDVFSFVQQLEGMDFPEALKLLADRAGVQIETFKSEIDKSQRNRLIEINSQAAYFFHRFLLDIPAAKEARDYLQRRELKSEMIERWKVGYAPDQWELLTKYLLKKGFSIDDLVASGLTIKRDGADAISGRGFYDRFRGRVMFPICDIHGNVVGFTGRVLVETENSGGKYVNTPQTPLYDKSRVIYGLDKAKMEIKAKDVTVLVEGQMDVLACHQAGMSNVVAASGTALTLEQVRLLKRYSNNLAIAFDADAAGQKAAKRGIDAAISEGMNIKVIKIPAGAGKDADECLKKNPSVWFEAVKNAQNIMEWYLEVVLAELDPHDHHSKQKAAEILLTQITKIPYGVERDEWMKRLSEELSIDINVLREEAKKIKAEAARAGQNQTARASANANGGGDDLARIETKKALAMSRFDLLLQEFWTLLFKYPEYYSAFANLLKKEYFEESVFGELYERVEKLYNIDKKLAVEKLRQSFLHESENMVDLLVIRPYKNFEEMEGMQVKEELSQIFTRIVEEWKKDQRKKLQMQMAQAEKSGDKIKVDRLMRAMLEL